MIAARSLIGRSLVLLAAAGGLGAAPAETGPTPAGLRERLEALGYVEEAEGTGEESGATSRDAARVQPGLNLYCSPWEGEVRVLDNQGRLVHRADLRHHGLEGSCHVAFHGDDDFVVVAYPFLSQFDSKGTVAWSSEALHHHDVVSRPDGSIYSLTELPGTLRRHGKEWPIRDHAISRFDSTGSRKDELLFSDVFGDRVPESRIHRMAVMKKRTDSFESQQYKRASDVFHPNSIEVLDRAVAGAGPGAVLLCLRELDLIAIVDPERQEVIWEWGPGQLDAPHNPSLLPNGNILVFDNGRARGWSRVVEVDPSTNQIVWEYRAPGFWSKLRGGAQRLPNGNTLITESQRGRVFEVTPAGTVVWEYWNDEETEDGTRRQIYRMQRLPAGPETTAALEARFPASPH